MASRTPDLALRPSVLDRLLGEAGPAGGGVDPAGSVASTRAAVMRDLEWLLNTRRIYTGPGEGRPELERSVYRYGLADITSLGRDSSSASHELARDLSESIRFFEPRLSQVRVSIRDPEESGSRVVRFVVEAMLDIDPEPMPISFDTRLDIGSGAFEVEADRV